MLALTGLSAAMAPHCWTLDVAGERHAVAAPHDDALRAARRELAASTALLPVTVEMAWAVPQLLKRARVISPDIASTSGVLRALIRLPECDERFAKALADSRFLVCDQVIARVRWKYDLAEMAAMHRSGADADVPAHCRTVLAEHRLNQPFDWPAVLRELRKLHSWFPELRTLGLLEQLYTRLHELHLQEVHVAQRWLDASARPGDAGHPNAGPAACR